MMIPVNNRLPQPPNDKWVAIADATPPQSEIVLLTDADKQFVWAGSISGEGAALPVLPATGATSSEKQPVYWSEVADQ